MSQETIKYDEDYLNGLIAKAKKSWEGVDVDSFMSDLRDNNMISYRLRGSNETISVSKDEFIKLIKTDIETKGNLK